MNETARAWLRDGHNQAKLRRIVRELTGRELAQSTTSRWATGKLNAGPCSEALVILAAIGVLRKAGQKMVIPGSPRSRRRRPLSSTSSGSA